MEKLRKTIEIGFIVALLFMLVGCAVPAKMTPPSWSQKLPAAERFVLVLDGVAVLDQETGLIWERSPSTSEFNWDIAQSHCNVLTLGNRMGWRLPTVQELASLVDPSVATPGPTLPSGHPFTNVQSSLYWSATTYAHYTTHAWDVNLNLGGVSFDAKSRDNHAWCVRGGQGVDPQ